MPRWGPAGRASAGFPRTRAATGGAPPGFPAWRSCSRCTNARRSWPTSPTRSSRSPAPPAPSRSSSRPGPGACSACTPSRPPSSTSRASGSRCSPSCAGWWTTAISTPAGWRPSAWCRTPRAFWRSSRTTSTPRESGRPRAVDGAVTVACCTGSMPSRQVSETRVVHGHRRAFVRAGDGPALLLLHGIGNNCQTWAGVIDRLAETHTVIAPDLLGHGNSDKPRGDYSIAAYANGMRDLLSVLDIEQATVVGHSLGGGIALQFAYQFPERCQRLALVGSGGLGPELSAGLRVATLPGAELVLGALTGVSGPLRLGLQVVERVGRAVGWRRVGDLAEAGDALLDLKDVEARRAFLRTLRGVVDTRGQAVTALDRLYLADSIPMLVVWGSRDPIVPAQHAEAVRESVPSARVEVFPGAGHWPHLDDPDRFCDVLLDFIATTAPAAHDLDSWRRLLQQNWDGGPRPVGR